MKIKQFKRPGFTQENYSKLVKLNTNIIDGMVKIYNMNFFMFIFFGKKILGKWLKESGVDPKSEINKKIK